MKCPRCGSEMEEAMAYNIWVCAKCKKSYEIYSSHSEKVNPDEK